MENKTEVRARLANVVLHCASRMTSSLLAVRLQLDPPKVAALRNGRLEIFSIERLTHFATRLGHDVEITVRPHPPKNFLRARLGEVRVVDHSNPDQITIA